jgi:archaellum biogenesis ATPase FlaH
MSDQISIYEWVKKYDHHKWVCIPVGIDKRPLIDWKKYQTERPTQEELKAWFDKPDAPNIGVVTGKISNLTVVDVEKGGMWLDLPSTMTSKTGGGGYHLFYRYAEGVGNSVRIRTLTDIRSEGGYVVVPPSAHASGNNYEWMKKEDEQPFPFEKFNFKPKSENNWEEILKGVGTGERNQSAAKTIGKILNSVSVGEWDTTAWEMFILWNMRNNPPLEEKELRSVFNSIKNTRVRTGQIPKENPETDECDIKLISEIAKSLTDDMTVSYPTGYKEYDEAFMGGFKEGDLVFLTGYTGQGKTLFCQSLCYNLIQKGHPCLFFSFEVTIGELWRKFKDMGVEDNFLAYSPEKTFVKKLDWICEKIIDARDRFQTRIIFIDHLGFLAQEPKNYDQNLAQNYPTILTMICRRLKAIAVQENIVIVLAGHLKAPQNGQSNDPTLHDIKDSSGIAQESDSVVIVSRQKKKMAYMDTGDVYENDNMIKIEKNRRTGNNKKFKVSFLKGRLVSQDEYMASGLGYGDYSAKAEKRLNLG